MSTPRSNFQLPGCPTPVLALAMPRRCPNSRTSNYAVTQFNVRQNYEEFEQFSDLGACDRFGRLV